MHGAQLCVRYGIYEQLYFDSRGNWRISLLSQKLRYMFLIVCKTMILYAIPRSDQDHPEFIITT